MTDKLSELLCAMPAPALDRSLDGLEGQVWGRIDAMRGAGGLARIAFGHQLAAAGMALAIGVALGWWASAPHAGEQDQSLYASYAEVGPIGRLESGL